MKLTRNILMAAFFLAAAAQVLAGKVVLRIRAGNRSQDKPEKVEIKSMLPAGVRTNDIIGLDGLDLGYDVRNDAHYVFKELELGPKEVRIFNVEINDIWTVPDEEIKRLKDRSDGLVGLLRGTESLTTGEMLQSQIRRDVAEIESRQAENAVLPGMPVMPHIMAHEENMALLRRVRLDIGTMENLALEAGRDPGSLMGDVRDVPKPRAFEIPPERYRIAIYRLSFRNSAPEKKQIPVRSELPSEIKSGDVLDSGGLEVGTDLKTGRCYLFKKGVELEPGANVQYEVKIRDKWNVNAERIPGVKKLGLEVLEKVQVVGGFRSIESDLEKVVGELEEMERVEGPQALNAEYIDFYRRQTERIDLLEEKIQNINARLQPKKPRRFGISTKPPTPKTTWMIIYIVLGFLFLMSLLFFLRWYGKSKAEDFDR